MLTLRLLGNGLRNLKRDCRISLIKLGKIRKLDLGVSRNIIRIKAFRARKSGKNILRIKGILTEQTSNI